MFVLFSSLRTPDPYLLLGNPGLPINLPRNWLSQVPHQTRERGRSLEYRKWHQGLRIKTLGNIYIKRNTKGDKPKDEASPAWGAERHPAVARGEQKRNEIFQSTLQGRSLIYADREVLVREMGWSRMEDSWREGKNWQRSERTEDLWKAPAGVASEFLSGGGLSLAKY